MSRYNTHTTFDNYADTTFIPPAQNANTLQSIPTRSPNRQSYQNSPCNCINQHKMCTCNGRPARASYTSTRLLQTPSVDNQYENQVHGYPNQNSRSTSAIRQEPVLNNQQFTQNRYTDNQINRQQQISQNIYEHENHFISEQKNPSQDFLTQKLKKENQNLIKENHELRKKEASSVFGKTNDSEFKNMRLENKNLISEINVLKTRNTDNINSTIINLENQTHSYRKNISILEQENSVLLSENQQLKSNHEKLTRQEFNKKCTCQSKDNSSNIQILKAHLKTEVENADLLNENYVLLKNDYNKLKIQFNDLNSQSTQRNEYEQIISNHVHKFNLLQTEKQNLERQNQTLQIDRNTYRSEIEIFTENKRRNVQKFDQENEELRNQLDAEIEDKNALFKDLEDLKRQYEVLRNQFNELGNKKTCKLNHRDETEDSHNVLRLQKKLHENKIEIDEHHQVVISLKQEIQKLKLKLSEMEANYEANLAVKKTNEKNKTGTLKLQIDELNLRVEFLKKENEKLREQPIHRHEIGGFTRPIETTVLNRYPSTTTRIVRSDSPFRPYDNIQSTITTQFPPVSSNFPPIYQQTNLFSNPNTSPYRSESIATSFMPNDIYIPNSVPVTTSFIQTSPRLLREVSVLYPTPSTMSFNNQQQMTNGR